MSRSHGVRRHENHSRDPVEISSYLRRMYGADLCLKPLRRRQGLRLGLDHSRIEAGEFALEEVRHDGDVETRAEGVSNLVVLWPIDGQVESRVCGYEAAVGPGHIVLGSTSVNPLRVRTRDATMRTVVLGQALLTKAAADLTTDHPARVRFDGLEPVTPEAGRALTAARRYVEQIVLADDALATPLVLAAAGRLLAATVLATFPNSVDGVGSGAHVLDGDDHHPALLRRAIAYIEEHAAEDISVADVASAVYVTPRALQYMFKRHLDSTPMAYLRRVRLDHVHHELVTGDRWTTTVTAAAARWGFAHTGRFAVLYRETYGQSPHVTLRR
jgi:AraC-like DNA-binding protein